MPLTCAGALVRVISCSPRRVLASVVGRSPDCVLANLEHCASAISPASRWPGRRDSARPGTGAAASAGTLPEQNKGWALPRSFRSLIPRLSQPYIAPAGGHELQGAVGPKRAKKRLRTTPVRFLIGAFAENAGFRPLSAFLRGVGALSVADVCDGRLLECEAWDCRADGGTGFAPGRTLRARLEA